MPLILGTNSIKDTGYDVANSLRFNTGSSHYIARTFGSGGNRKTFTFSWWIKRVGVEGSDYFISGMSGSSEFNMFFDSSGRFGIDDFNGSAYGFQLRTNRVFRDPSAWMHIVLAFDTTQATSNRIKLYINGTQYTWDNQTTYPSQNYDTQANVNGRVLEIGRLGGSYNTAYADMYLAEMVFVNGLALAPTDFGEFDSDSPTIWKPIDVSGLTFGTNGFYLDFENASSLGADVSGNSNNFTVYNLTSIDQSTDTCTNNFATLNPLNYSSVSKTYSFGNTAITSSDSGSWNATLSNFAVSSGKWYTEYKILNVGSFSAIGVGYQPFNFNASAYLGSTFLVGEDTGSFGWRNNGATKSDNANGTLSSWTTNDILMIAIDMDNQKLYVGKNGTWENSGNPESGATGTGSVKNLTAGEDYLFVICPRGGGTSVNFGSPSFTISSGNSDGNGYGNFEYAVPSGYYALNTKNLAEFG